MGLVSNNSDAVESAPEAKSDLAGIIEESKAALKTDEKSGAAPKRGRGRPSKAAKAAEEAAAAAAAGPAPFDPNTAKPAGLAPVLFPGIKMMAAGYSGRKKVPHVTMPDADASACADSLDMAIGVAFPETANSRWGVVFACVLSAAAVALKFGSEVNDAVLEKKKNEFTASNTPQDPVFSVPQTVAATPGAIQTHL